ncbi:MAG TPA: hypothetical protein VLA31_01430, partial [Burkholderiaceae bacterium]|nr:hypothetical protein [Burkholderiaceae bacterium]
MMDAADASASQWQENSEQKWVEEDYKWVPVASLIVKNYRDIRRSRTVALQESICEGWAHDSILLVQTLQVADNMPKRWRVIAGGHRVYCVKLAIAQRQLPADYKVPCKVFKHDTPRHLVLIMAGAENASHSLLTLESFTDRIMWTESMVRELKHTGRKKVTHEDMCKLAEVNGKPRHGFAKSNYVKYFSAWRAITTDPQAMLIIRMINVAERETMLFDRAVVWGLLPTPVTTKLNAAGIKKDGAKVTFADDCFSITGNYSGIWSKLVEKQNDVELMARHQVTWYLLSGKPRNNAENKVFVAQLAAEGAELSKLWHEAVEHLRKLHELNPPPAAPAALRLEDKRGEAKDAEEAKEEQAGGEEPVAAGQESAAKEAADQVAEADGGQEGGASSQEVDASAANILATLADSNSQLGPLPTPKANETYTFPMCWVGSPWLRVKLLCELGYLEAAREHKPQVTVESLEEIDALDFDDYGAQGELEDGDGHGEDHLAVLAAERRDAALETYKKNRTKVML